MSDIQELKIGDQITVLDEYDNPLVVRTVVSIKKVKLVDSKNIDWDKVTLQRYGNRNNPWYRGGRIRRTEEGDAQYIRDRINRRHVLDRVKLIQWYKLPTDVLEKVEALVADAS